LGKAPADFGHSSPIVWPEWSDVEKWELADDPERVIRFNRRGREADPGAFFDDRAWPPRYFVLGSEPEQNWYFLDLASGSEAVYLFDHEMGEVQPVADSLAAFPEYLLDWWHDVERWG